MTPQKHETKNEAVARLLMEIAIRVAYIEQIQDCESDEVLRCARQLVKALKSCGGVYMTDPIASPDPVTPKEFLSKALVAWLKDYETPTRTGQRNNPKLLTQARYLIEAAKGQLLAASAGRETEPSDDDDRDEVDAILQSVLVMLGLPGFRKEWFVNDRWNFGALRQHGLDARLAEIRAAEKLAAGREIATPHALDVDIADVVACFARWEADGRSVMPPYLESALRDLVRSWKDHRKALVTRRETPAPPSESLKALIVKMRSSHLRHEGIKGDYLYARYVDAWADELETLLAGQSSASAPAGEKP